MKARPLLRVLPVAGLVIAMAGFILGPATPAAASHGLGIFVYELNVAKGGTGLGTVSSNDGAIAVGAVPGLTDTALYPDDLGHVVTLTALPSPGSWFAGWSLSSCPAGSPSGGSCTLDLDTTGTGLFGLITNISAIFTSGPFGGYPYGIADVHVNKAGTGSGSVVSSNIGGINCGTDCNEVYGWATGLTLTAIPNPGSSFAGWNVSGGATNVIQNANQISLNLNWPYWDWNTWPWNFNNFNYSTLVTATFNTATATVATAAASTFTHLHQHGGIVTGRVHHGVYHAKKHVHTHSHAL